ncbi:hypothetical protein G5I_01723 [Acromyrmex echinatior]|uniref:Uncharacterized protein n=1 Tax=Acromyrmex echinatior TaxID=103372 RepID=F4W8E2_ACREC|nr:hypothetical protein G5I_01723 [Acromyrmex echinatior]
MDAITEGKHQKRDTVDYRGGLLKRLGSTCRLFPDSIIRLLHTDIHRTPENSEQIGNTDSSKLLSLDHEQKPPRSFCKLTVDRRKCAKYYVLANRLQTGIRYRVRHLDIISDDRDAATGGEGRRATGGPFLPRSEGHAHRRDIRPLSSSLRFSDGTKESGVLYAVRLASADDSPRPPSLSYGQVISDNGLHRAKEKERRDQLAHSLQRHQHQHQHQHQQQQQQQQQPQQQASFVRFGPQVVVDPVLFLLISNTAAAAAAAAAAATAEEEEEEEEEVVEEEEEKTRNTLACSKRKEQIKFKGEELEEGERMEQKERNSLLAGSKRKGRDVEKDGERARVRSGRN